ncbi:MAG: glycosyltransferase family 39 protein [Anaerolineaceae bacterium]|nr:glycosyltransferase family 39 protein [Anaerolineaceae bacterium]
MQKQIINKTLNEKSSSKKLNIIVSIILMVFTILILRRAWVSEDAYITFRTIDNFVNGYSLTWNAGERVQAYTHPLWMFFNSIFYIFTHEVFLTSIFVSIIVSLAAIILAVRLAHSTTSAIAGIILLSLSNAYVDYATSGLENPMTHLLLVIFLILFYRGQENTGKNALRNLFFLSMLSSLALVNRMDTVLLYMPALIYAFIKTPNKWKAVGVFIAGQIPFIFWELFSILYYGFPFPNTAYAKLNTGIPAAAIVRQGLFYLLNSIVRDPLTMVTVFAGCLSAWFSRNRKDWVVSAGIVLYVLYVIKIGGGFMSGRFLTAIFLAAVILLMRLDINRFKKIEVYSLIGALLLLGVLAPLPTYQLSASDDFPRVDQNGIADERLWYFEDMSLANISRFEKMPKVLGRYTGIEARVEAENMKDLFIAVRKNTGAFGYYAGPGVYIVDYLALSDPLLARLPAIRDVGWRIGHFERIVPEGYLSSVYHGKGMLEDEKLSAYYEQLVIITRGSLFSKERLKAIWGMNIGKFDDLIDYQIYRYPDQVQVNLRDLYTGLNIGQTEEISFGDSGVIIKLESIQYIAQIRLTVESFTDYEIIFKKGDLEIDRVNIISSQSPEGFSERLISIPNKALEKGFNSIMILPLNGDSHYFFNNIQLFKASED